MVLSMPISHATAICSTVCLFVSCACWCYVSACSSMLVCSSPGMCLYVCLSLCLSFNVSYSMYVYPSLSDCFTLCQFVYLRHSISLFLSVSLCVFVALSRCLCPTACLSLPLVPTTSTQSFSLSMRLYKSLCLCMNRSVWVSV